MAVCAFCYAKSGQPHLKSCEGLSVESACSSAKDRGEQVDKTGMSQSRGVHPAIADDLDLVLKRVVDYKHSSLDIYEDYRQRGNYRLAATYHDRASGLAIAEAIIKEIQNNERQCSRGCDERYCHEKKT